MNLATFLHSYAKSQHEFKFFPDVNGNPYGLAAVVFYIHNIEISLSLNGRANNKYDLMSINPLQSTHMDVCISREDYTLYSRTVVELRQLRNFIDMLSDEMSDELVYRLASPLLGYFKGETE